MIATKTSPNLVPVCKRANDGAAALNREMLGQAGVVAIALCGGPGCGKTRLLQETLKTLAGDLRVGVILGNIRAEQDAEQLRGWCTEVQPVETLDLDASMVREALGRMHLSKLDLIFIERAGAGLPAPQDLGQNSTVGIFSVSGGDDKVFRYPERVENADLILITKSDLKSIMPFDDAQFCSAVMSVKPGVPILEVSTLAHDGIEAWCEWIHRAVGKPTERFEPLQGEYFVG